MKNNIIFGVILLSIVSCTFGQSKSKDRELKYTLLFCAKDIFEHGHVRIKKSADQLIDSIRIEFSNKYLEKDTIQISYNHSCKGMSDFDGTSNYISERGQKLEELFSNISTLNGQGNLPVLLKVNYFYDCSQMEKDFVTDCKSNVV